MRARQTAKATQMAPAMTATLTSMATPSGDTWLARGPDCTCSGEQSACNRKRTESEKAPAYIVLALYRLRVAPRTFTSYTEYAVRLLSSIYSKSKLFVRECSSKIEEPTLTLVGVSLLSWLSLLDLATS